ncbi:MAG: DUF1127 domain-containing protein [Rhodobacterales bacterium]|nr:DUF1127 domain-containing protein [Rhodobacterales bacterium]
MTTLYQNRASTVAGSTNNSFFANLISSVAAWNNQRVTRKSLSRLTDRELDDIGLVRGDISRM